MVTPHRRSFHYLLQGFATVSSRGLIRRRFTISRQPARADDRHRQSASEDRIAEPRVQRPPPRDAGADGCSMRVKSACAARNGAPGGYSGAAPPSDHLSIGRRSARADDHAAKMLLFEVPISNSAPLPRAMTSSHEISSLQFNWLLLPCCLTED